MKHHIAAALLVIAPYAALAQAPPEIRFDANVEPLTLPAGMNFGEVVGISLNSKKHVFVFTRTGERSTVHGASASQLFEFDNTGRYLREIGKDLYGFAFAHTVRVDKDDNIWTTDEGTNTIVRFNPAGRVTMVLGRREEAVEAAAPPAPGTPPRPGWGTFNRPADIAWDLNGNIFVADGYGNSRVVKIDRNGKWLKTWGTRGSEPGQFNILHTIANDARGNIYIIGDRTNRRIQVFDPEGNPVRIITVDVPFNKEPDVMLGAAPGSGSNPLAVSGAPWAICITPGPTQFLYVADAVPGRIYKLTLDGKVLGVLGEAGKQARQFGWIHQMACPSENEIWVAEILNWRVQKLVLH
ncbi:MAG: repeat-containing protein [Gemmatimonadetes bacterium]|nr:repeat-containing protein [Gemmatimonadota bacterium]